MHRLTFFDAPCVALTFALDAPGTPAASGLRLRFSPAAVDLQGVFVELHSRLAWEPDAAVRRRALIIPFMLPVLAPPRPVGPRPLPPLAPVAGGAVGRAAARAGQPRRRAGQRDGVAIHRAAEAAL